MDTIKIRTLEVAGIAAAFQSLRLPYNKAAHTVAHSDADVRETDDGTVVDGRFSAIIPPEDIRLMQQLIIAGDEHSKPMRGVIAWADISAPLYFFTEEETYTVGHQRLFSESTMHGECRGMLGEELQRAKAAIPCGRIIRKVDCFSYQTLRRIAAQRHGHRLPEWRSFIEWIHTLPLSNELIFNGLKEF